ncbi:unnamed protein product [Amaranthus hypochondriacus]
MEIPVINRMTDSLHNPSFISRILSTLELGKLSNAHRLWKWGALFLALVYAFSSIINKFKLLMLYFHNKSKSLLAASEPLLSQFDDAFLTDDDENDDVCSISATSSDEDEDDEDEGIIEEFSRFDDDDFNVKGSFRSFSENPRKKGKFKLLRRRRSFVENFSLSDLVNGNGVVKLWDGLDLGLVEVHDAFSFLDLDNYENGKVIEGIPAASSSPAVFITGDGKTGMNIWDMRTNGKSPAFQSDWRSDRRVSLIGVDGGRTGKVYAMDDVSMGLMVADVRKFESPLKEEYAEDLWWDADESTHEFAE